MKLHYAAASFPLLLFARIAVAHPGHLPIEAGVKHEVTSPDHLGWWVAVGVVAAAAGPLLRLLRRARETKSPVGPDF